MKTWLISCKKKLKQNIEKSPFNVLFQLFDHTLFYAGFVLLLYLTTLRPNCLGNVLEVAEIFWIIIIPTIVMQVGLLVLDIMDDSKYLLPICATVDKEKSKLPWIKVSPKKLGWIFVGFIMMFVFSYVSQFIYRNEFSQTAVSYQFSHSVSQAYTAGEDRSVLAEMFTWPVKSNKVYRERFVLLLPLLGGLLDQGQKEKVRTFLLENKSGLLETLKKYREDANDFFSIVDPERLSYNVLFRPAVFEKVSINEFERYRFFPKSLQRVRLEAFRLTWLARIEQEYKSIGLLAGSDSELLATRNSLTSFVQAYCLADQRNPSSGQLQEAVAIYPLLIKAGWSEMALEKIFFERAKNRPVVDDLYGKVKAGPLFWNLNETENMMAYFCSTSPGSKDNRFFDAVKKKFE